MGRAIANSNRNISVVGNRRHAYRTHKMHSAIRVARACDDASALLGARDPSAPAPAPLHSTAQTHSNKYSLLLLLL